IRIFRRLSRRSLKLEQSHILDCNRGEICRHTHRRDVFRLVNVLVVTLHFDRPDNASHYRHWNCQRRIRTQTVLWTNYYTALLGPHVVVGDDYLARAHRATIRTRSRDRHRRQLRSIELIAVGPTITASANITNRIVKRDEKAVTRNRDIRKL